MTRLFSQILFLALSLGLGLVVGCGRGEVDDNLFVIDEPSNRVVRDDSGSTPSDSGSPPSFSGSSSGNVAVQEGAGVSEGDSGATAAGAAAGDSTVAGGDADVSGPASAPTSGGGAVSGETGDSGAADPRSETASGDSGTGAGGGIDGAVGAGSDPPPPPPDPVVPPAGGAPSVEDVTPPILLVQGDDTLDTFAWQISDGESGVATASVQISLCGGGEVKYSASYSATEGCRVDADGAGAAPPTLMVASTTCLGKTILEVAPFGNGGYCMVVEAVDRAGNRATSPTVSVTVLSISAVDSISVIPVIDTSGTKAPADSFGASDFSDFFHDPGSDPFRF